MRKVLCFTCNTYVDKSLIQCYGYDSTLHPLFRCNTCYKDRTNPKAAVSSREYMRQIGMKYKGTNADGDEVWSNR